MGSVYSIKSILVCLNLCLSYTDGHHVWKVNHMTYYESAEGETVTRLGALKLLDIHNIPESERKTFDMELGEKDNYDAQEVLRWLGY